MMQQKTVLDLQLRNKFSFQATNSSKLCYLTLSALFFISQSQYMISHDWQSLLKRDIRVE